MLSFFPAPYPDELLYSVLARYQVRSGNTSPKMTMTEVFGTSSVTAVVDMPSCIDALAARIPKEKRVKAIDLIMNNTLFPYYTAFLDKKRIKAVVAAMSGDRGGSIHTMVGIMASTVSTPKYLRFCLECFKEDRDRYGEYYWHRMHQIPGVILCPSHKSMIQDSTVNLSNQNRHEFIAADDNNCITRPVEIKCSDLDLESLLQLSKDIEWIIRRYDVIRSEVDSDAGLRDRYMSMLKEKGYATVNGRVYQGELISSFIEFYGHSFLKMVQSEVEYKDESNWLSGIVRKHRKSFHPVRHLLLMRFLSGSAEEFFKNATVYMPFGKGPWPCLNPAADHYKKFVIKNIKVTHCSDTKLPVGTFECLCGFVYSRRGPDASENDLYKIGRIQCFGSIWEEKLRRLVNDKNIGLREAARQLRADPKTIKIYSKRLGIKTKWDETNGKTDEGIGISDTESTVEKNETMLEYHRNVWISLIKANPCASKTRLRKLAKAHYAWLYRHHKDWLDENSPKPRNIPKNKYRVDWQKRDAEFIKKAKVTVNEILMIKGKPVRVSLSKVGKMVGQLGLLEKHLDKMPRTKAYFESVIETYSDYRKRRIKWAIQELSNLGNEPKEWNVMRKAGIRWGYVNEVKRYML